MISALCRGTFEALEVAFLDGLEGFIPEVEGLTPQQVSTVFFTWRMEGERANSIWWQQAIETSEEGRMLRESHNLAVWIQRLSKLDIMEPHRCISKGLAIESERTKQDLTRENFPVVTIGGTECFVRDLGVATLRLLHDG